ncbi:rRNA maturation RNase YbeY [Candidatus Uhrbacteria bacterium]|nr:rRNA maturation RNase YbeY [Candidatus Uhrbacteria bacterium]
MLQAELNQDLLRGGQKLSKPLVRKVLVACSRAFKHRGDATISIGFVSASQMRALNKTWRGKDRVTDVLSFELDEGPLKGEVLLNYAQAARQARDMGHSTRDELCFLIVHGVLHLWGYDHETPRDAKRMFSLQEKVLRSLHIDPRL